MVFAWPDDRAIGAKREGFGRNGADGGNRTLMRLPSTDFRTTSAFAAAPSSRSAVRGLDYPFTLATALGAARLVSTPSRCRAWLATAIEGFPDFAQFCIASFPA